MAVIPELGSSPGGPVPGNRNAIHIACGLRPRSHYFVEVDRPDPPVQARTLPPGSSGSHRRRPGSGCRRSSRWFQTESPMPLPHFFVEDPVRPTAVRRSDRAADRWDSRRSGVFCWASARYGYFGGWKGLEEAERSRSSSQGDPSSCASQAASSITGDAGPTRVAARTDLWRRGFPLR